LKLVPVFQAASLRDFANAVPGTRAFSVLRQSGDVPHVVGSQGVSVLALPAHDLTSIRWRRDNASASPKELQRLLHPTAPLPVHGVQTPPDARVLTLPLRPGSAPLAVRAVILHGGRAYGLPLGTTDSRRLAARVPAGARGGLLVSFTFDLTGTGLHGVANGGGNVLTYAVGTMRVDAPRVDGRRLPFDVSAWTGKGGLTP